VGGPFSGPNVSTDSSRQLQPLGQMVQSQALVSICQMYQLTLSCLTMAPSIMSQWNERKLAPNYRLLSLKNGTGAGGVCHCVEAGWLSHCGTEAEDIQNTHTGHEEITHIYWNTRERRGEPPFFLVGLCLNRVPPSHGGAVTETTCVPSLIQQN